jgi:hypothetical protein
LILGFAHLTATTANGAETRRHWLARGWTEKYVAHDVPSAEQKWPLMAGRARSHDLYMLEGRFWVEVVEHDTGAVADHGRIVYRETDGRLDILSRDAEREAAFFVEALSFSADRGNSVALRSRFPHWSIALNMIEDETAALDPPLDVEGLSCLAFYSTDVVADAARIARHGGRDAIAPFEIRVRDQTLRILMLRSPEGTVIELIQILKTKTSLTHSS